jgi:hypothetical protein
MTAQYDLQVHTDASPCSNASPEAIVDAAVESGLDGIAITDHDTLANVGAVAERAPQELDVVPGVEVTTTQGHLLALGVSTPPPRADPLDVIENVHEQGGRAVLSHPFDTLRQYYEEDLATIAAAVDGVEASNSRCVRPAFNRRAAAFAERHGLPTVGGSDAHFPMEVGRAYTLADRPVLEALADGETAPAGRGGYLSGHVATKLHQARSRLR